MQEEYREKDKKLYLCFVDLKKAFDRVSRRVMQLALSKKRLPEILLKAVVSLYEGSKTKVIVGSEFSEEFVVVGVHQGSVLSLLLFAIVVDNVTDNVRKGLMKKVLHADNLVLMSEMMEGLKERFLKWRSTLKSKGLKVNLEKTKMMVCGSEGEVIWSRIHPCGLCGKMVIVNSVLCTKCDQWIHGRGFKLKKVTPSAATFFVCNMCNKATNGVGEAQQEVICDEVKTVKRFCYLGNRLNASGGCEAAVIARTRLDGRNSGRLER